MRRRNGLTLIELLVVVAIIGTLAAILLPAFAQARATRDTQCIANVKAIATAIRMYATDYEELWPGDRSERVQEYFSQSAGRWGMAPSVCSRTRSANPYLRPAVILEDYVKSRQVWRCPRATLVNRAVWIVPPGPGDDWLQSYRDHQGEWGSQRRRHRAESGAQGELSPSPSSPPARESPGASENARPGVAGPCLTAFPTGWGGAVTDSFLQGAARGPCARERA